MNTDKKIKLLVAAGGTGGHLFPALAVLEQISKLTEGNFEAEFVGNASRIEGRVLPNLGYKLHNINISGFSSIFSVKTFLLPYKIMQSIRECRSIIRKFQPDAILCAGAYISYPAGVAASRENIPLFLMESNVIPGKTIRMLSSKAKIIFTAFEDSEEYFPQPLRHILKPSGNPVRADIMNTIPKEIARQKFELDPYKRTVLIFGGSLGAMSINRAVEQAIEQTDSGKAQFLWQTGKNFLMPDNLPDSVKAFQFIDDMASAYCAADLVFSRSGATSVAEICIAGKPSVLIPYPNAANNHQEYNALLLQEKGAAIMVSDTEISEVMPEIISEYLFDDDALKDLGDSALKLSKPDAAEFTAKEILNNIF